MWTSEARFHDRRDAGRRLAERLRSYQQSRPIVLALPRGGVPVGYEVAHALSAPLDVMLVRKLGVPGHEELAMGAIASGGVRVLNPDVVSGLSVPSHVIDKVSAEEQLELQRREQLYRSGRPFPNIHGRTVLVVDDGLATGSTMRAAVAALRSLHPRKIIVAVPTAAASTCEQMRRIADDCICVIAPESFYAVGQWYVNFSQTSDEEVRELLDLSAAEVAAYEGKPGVGAHC